jgi:predicted CoA-substrate-specific enzyme activase
MVEETGTEKHPLVAGIDIGSRSIELVLLQDSRLVHWDLLPTTFDPLGQCRSLLDRVKVERIVATGYGRKLLLDNLDHPGVTAITEIQAYALGARHLFPGVRTILDIGGQDTKAIALTLEGKVAKFEMNDRCAAGTGKFLEFMAVALQVPLEKFGDFALQADRRLQINSMCTVFAESEATSLMARGESPANIALGLHLAIVSRTVAMLHRVGMTPPVLFAGGVAHNPCIKSLLEESLGEPVLVPAQPDLVGALGAALFGQKLTGKEGELPSEDKGWPLFEAKNRAGTMEKLRINSER